MEPFSRIEEAQRFLEQRVYDHFRQTSEWPRARDMDLDYHELLDPLGGLEVVCRRIGPDRIWCGSPTSESDRVTLRLAALATCEGSETDVANFLHAVRLAADRYHAVRGKEAALTVADLVEALRIDEPAARRALLLMAGTDALSGGGAPGHVSLAHLTSRMRGVTSLQDYLARVAAGEERGRALAEAAAGRVARHRQRPARRIFLSHAADDATLANYLADVIRTGSQATVFVASKAGNIPTGSDWLSTIEQELRQADTYLLLLTPFSVNRFWLWYESGAAWMSERALVPVTAAGLAKADVPYPLGARQALSLEVAADAAQLAQDLHATIPDVERFCQTVKALCDSLPWRVASHEPADSEPGWQGVTVRDRYFAWEGPHLHALPDRSPIQAPPEAIEALRAAGHKPSFGVRTRLREHQASGAFQVYETDRVSWRRELLQSPDGQVLLVRPAQ